VAGAPHHARDANNCNRFCSNHLAILANRTKTGHARTSTDDPLELGDAFI